MFFLQCIWLTISTKLLHRLSKVELIGLKQLPVHITKACVHLFCILVLVVQCVHCGHFYYLYSYTTRCKLLIINMSGTANYGTQSWKCSGYRQKLFLFQSTTFIMVNDPHQPLMVFHKPECLHSGWFCLPALDHQCNFFMRQCYFFMRSFFHPVALNQLHFVIVC